MTKVRNKITYMLQARITPNLFENKQKYNKKERWSHVSKDINNVCEIAIHQTDKRKCKKNRLKRDNRQLNIEINDTVAG